MTNTEVEKGSKNSGVKWVKGTCFKPLQQLLFGIFLWAGKKLRLGKVK